MGPFPCSFLSCVSQVKPRQIFTMSVFESYWANKAACDDAERAYYEKLSGCKSAQAEAPAAKKEGGSASEEEPAKNPGAFKNAANGERTFIMCKPDAVQRGLVGEIIERFERRGMRLLCAKMMHAPESLLKEHYADLSKKGFFSELIRYMGSGPVVPMVWQGLGAVKQGRVLLGATNPKDSAPGTIRGDLCIDVGRNIIHGSDSVESAEKEIGLWFSQAEITSWRSAQTEWVYEEEELEPLQVLPSKVDGLVSASGSSEDMALVKKLNALEEEKKRITEERLKAYHEKKSKKPQVIAKTSVLLDVKPWDDETDHDQMLASVKSIEMDGLLWGAHKLIPIGYGIKKLQVMCTVEDEKVSVEELTEKIEEFEDFVQSCDVNAMNKI